MHTGMRIRTMELLNPDNPISVPPDCRADQPDSVLGEATVNAEAVCQIRSERLRKGKEAKN